MLDKFLKYLIYKYPTNYRITLRQFKKATDRDLVAQIAFNQNTATIDIVHWNRSERKKLHSLAHEYKHAIDGPKKTKGPDWEREIAAEYFATAAVKEFLKEGKR